MPALTAMNHGEASADQRPGPVLWLAAVFMAVAVLAFVPAQSDALNHFDPLKRSVWGCLAVLLAFSRHADGERTWDVTSVSAIALGVWMALRTLLRPNPMSEVSVLFTWMLPLVLFLLGRRIALHGRRLILGLLGGLVIVQLTLMGCQYGDLDPFFGDTTAVFAWRGERMIGTVGYHNQAADFVGLGMLAFLPPCAVSVWGWCGIGLSLAGIGLTACRTALLATGTALGLSFPLLPIPPAGAKPRRFKVLFGMAMVMAATVGVLALNPHVRDRWQATVNTGIAAPGIASRLMLARAGIDMFTARPWTGWGAGSYAYQYMDRIAAVRVKMKPATAAAVVYAREAHNDGVQFAAEFGVVGLLLAVGLFWRIVAASWTERRSDPIRFAAVVYVLAYMVVAGTGTFIWQTAVTGPVAGFLMGWLTPIHKIATSRIGERAQRLAGAAVRVLSGGGAVLVAVWFAGAAFWDWQIAEAVANGQVLSLKPVTPAWAYETQGFIGGALAQRGQFAEAETVLRHALEGFREPTLYNNLGNVLASQGKWQEAEVVYGQWADTGINEPMALANLAVACEKQGKVGEAADALGRRDAIVGADSMEGVQRLAGLLLKAGAPKQALARIRQCERQAGGNGTLTAELENMAGAANLMLKDYSNAVTRFEAALRKKPGLESARRNLDGIRANGVRAAHMN